MPEGKTELVFVYGTLRRNASNAFRMKGGTWEGMRTVNARLYQISWYPGLILSDECEKVIGELWQVDAGQLRQLDEFEGIPAGTLEGEEYRRIRTKVDPLPDLGTLPEWETSFEPTEAHEAWVWEWKGNPDDAVEITTGDWLDVESPRQKPLFTSLGCLAVLSFTIGTQALIAGGLALFPSWRGAANHFGWIHFGSLAMAILVGGYSLRMATRRREPGHAFQVMTGLALTFLGMTVLIRLLITLFTKVFG